MCEFLGRKAMVNSFTRLFDLSGLIIWLNLLANISFAVYFKAVLCDNRLLMMTLFPSLVKSFHY